MIIFMNFKISKIYDSIVYLKQFFKTFFFIYCLILVHPPKNVMIGIIGKMNWGQKVRGIYLRYIMCKCQAVCKCGQCTTCRSQQSTRTKLRD